MAFNHEPVMLTEVIDWLSLKPNDNVIDATVGAGGHAFKLLEKTGPNGRLWGFDQDKEAIKTAKENLKEFSKRINLINQPFQDCKHVKYALYRTLAPIGVSAILVDCGVSSYQFGPENDRGFSFLHNGRLDMRFGPFGKKTAADIVNNYPSSSLIKIFQNFGQERRAKLFAERIVAQRQKQPIFTVNQLLNAIGLSKFQNRRIHPATKVFQALRMEVNDELGALQIGLPALADYLTIGGRMAVITFHSVEDRTVKQTLASLTAGNKYRLLTKHVIKPTREEILKNRRSRSAKMRVIQRIN
jgi:16S rRNA (cytosine1402-N4)-methyltransferase